MSSDQSDSPHPDTAPVSSAANTPSSSGAPPEGQPAAAAPQAAEPSAASATPGVAATPSPAPAPRRIAIGSQRAGSRVQRPRIPPALYPRQKQNSTVAPDESTDDVAAADTPETSPPQVVAQPSVEQPTAEQPASEQTITAPSVQDSASPAPPVAPAVAPSHTTEPSAAAAPAQHAQQAPAAERAVPARPPRGDKTPVPSIRGDLPDEWQREVEEALGNMSIDEMLDPTAVAPATSSDLAPDSRHKGTVISIHRDDVFIDLGGPCQGVLSLRQLPEPPGLGSTIEVVVVRFSADDGLYQLTVPHGAVVAANWADITEGVVVEARVTGHNKGGLECEVNNIRGFIPASQIDVYRVEDLSQFVGQKLPCVVTEARPERGNLVLSRRAVLEREKAESKERLLGELAVGQVREGVVRSLQPFGAFVDLGGVDGLLHVSQLSWQRVKHPSEVLQLGQKVKVLVRKIDADTHKISLALRDLTENPWSQVAAKFPVTSTIRGPVTKIMEFGAFVELEPGVEGLVHISELAHQRVWRVSDIVKEGDTVDAKVVSIDPEKQRIGLSMKALAAKPGPVKKEEPEPEDDSPLPPARKSKVPLKGGLGKSSGGEQFGLKW